MAVNATGPQATRNILVRSPRTALFISRIAEPNGYLDGEGAK